MAARKFQGPTRAWARSATSGRNMQGDAQVGARDDQQEEADRPLSIIRPVGWQRHRHRGNELNDTVGRSRQLVGSRSLML